MEKRLGDLEAQIDRLYHTLLRVREADEHAPLAEQRLAQLTERCADILKQWTSTSERHARVVNELETRLTGWDDVEARLQHNVSWRFQDLERLIEREWASLRSLHEEPVRQLRAHAESLTEICVNTAGSAQTGIERAEARLAMLEKDLHQRMDDLSRDLHAVVAELRQQGIAMIRGPASSWSLDEVTRLHQELRDTATGGPSRPAALGGSVLEGSTAALALRPAPAVLESDGETRTAPTIDPSGGESSAAAGEPARAIRFTWKSYTAIAVVAIASVFAGSAARTLSSRVTLAAEHASEAQHRADLIATAADERIEAARHDAAAQIAVARDAASKAQVISDVLAAPDLVRFNLTGGDGAARTSAQLLWSRSRGLVFSGSRLPLPPVDKVYQVWLLTAGEPVSAGTFGPDPSGRVTLATDSPPAVPRPLVGVRVTLEPAPGGAAPSGATVLARLQ